MSDTEKRIAFVRLLQRARAETGEDKPGSALLALVAALDARATEAERMASIHKAESDEIDRLTQRWTAQVEHMKAGIVALANAWESRTRRGSGAGKRVTYRICSRELLAEWDRLALEAAPPERERGAMGPFCGYCQHHHHHAGIRCREGGCECLGMDGGAHRMDAADGPTCRCGRPSRHESGWCGECTPETKPAPGATEIVTCVGRPEPHARGMFCVDPQSAPETKPATRAPRPDDEETDR